SPRATPMERAVDEPRIATAQVRIRFRIVSPPVGMGRPTSQAGDNPASDSRFDARHRARAHPEMRPNPSFHPNYDRALRIAHNLGRAGGSGREGMAPS